MTVTEQEANTKWCPQARIDICCMGSKCMAWRWDEPRLGAVLRKEPILIGQSKPDWADGCDQEAEHWISRETTSQGYCGLAGMPSP